MRLLTNKKRLIDLSKKLTPEYVEQQLAWCVHKIEQNMERYGTRFPSAAATKGKYRLKDNDDWTNGFWTGMVWMCYEHTGEEKFKELAFKNITSFEKRLQEHFVMDHHDIGFLYSLSVGAGFKITQDPQLALLLVQAADVLLQRFQEKGNFIQAWGALDDPEEYRLIIDSLVNLPLLYQATEISGDSRYAEVADKHYATLMATVLKKDATTFHTYYFDYQTGVPRYGKTYQGYADDSIWARGQSWAILGIPLVEKLRQSQTLPKTYPEIVDIFLQHLPEDLVPYWDFVFDDLYPAEKDSSSLAIVANGLWEASSFDSIPQAKELAKGMLYQLSRYYTSQSVPDNEGLLLHGVYAYPQGKGVDEPNLFGDYFYLELLMRCAHEMWQGYW